MFNISPTNAIFFIEALKEKELKFFVKTLSSCYWFQFNDNELKEIGSIGLNRSYWDGDKLTKCVIDGLIQDILIEGSVDYNVYINQLEYNQYIDSLTQQKLLDIIIPKFDTYLCTDKYTKGLTADNKIKLTESSATRLIFDVINHVLTKIVSNRYEEYKVSLQNELNGFQLHTIIENNFEQINETVDLCIRRGILMDQINKIRNTEHTAESMIAKLAIAKSFDSVKPLLVNLDRLAKDSYSELLVKRD